ncbi:MAG: hypothetical protein CMJ40_04605 [Phycisphaerae bacterium]|nr:hypothetical protein [Phycisphaerae bacterium]
MSQISLEVKRGELIKPAQIGGWVDVVNKVNQSCLGQHGVYSLCARVQSAAGSSFGTMRVAWGADNNSLQST